MTGIRHTGDRLVDRLGVEVVVVDRMAIKIALAAVKPMKIGLS